MSHFVVGLTGGIASGKSTVSDLFDALDIEVIDADIIAREVVEPGTPAFDKLIEHFSSDILGSNGDLDRTKLRAKVFNDSAEKDWLNALLHPLIRSAMIQQVKEAQSPYCILSVPLLIENNLMGMVDRVLVVDVDEALQLERACKRDNSAQNTIKNIIKAQTSRQNRLDHADDVIKNDKDLDNLRAKVAQLHKNYLNIANENL